MYLTYLFFKTGTPGGWRALLWHGRTLAFFGVIQLNASYSVTTITPYEYRLSEWHSTRRADEMFTPGWVYRPKSEACEWGNCFGPNRTYVQITNSNASNRAGDSGAGLGARHEYVYCRRLFYKPAGQRV